jgi:hypothetical protein
VSCTPDFCDIHDYPVAPGGGWCRRIDTLHRERQNATRVQALNEPYPGGDPLSSAGEENTVELAAAIRALTRIVSQQQQRPAQGTPARTRQAGGYKWKNPQ